MAPRAVAAFALASAEVGVPLPASRFRDPLVTVTEQWRAYVHEQCGDNDLCSATLSLRTTEMLIYIDLDVNMRLNVFRLKPLIEELNTSVDGLGWLVYEAIQETSAHGYPMYLPAQLGEFADYLWFDDAETDSEFLKKLKERGDMNPRTSLKRAREVHHGQWPSDLLAAVDGHGWIYGWKNHPRPKSATKKAARDFLRRTDNAVHKHVVASALDLLGESPRGKPHILDDVGRPNDGEELREDPDYESFGCHYYGGAAFVAWNDPQPLIETVSHYEEYVMQADDGTTTHLVIRARCGDHASLLRAANQLKALVRHHALVAKLLAPFHYEED